MIPPHRAENLVAWLTSIEGSLVHSIGTRFDFRRFHGWKTRAGRRSGPGRAARAETRVEIVKMLADLRKVRAWIAEVSR